MNSMPIIAAVAAILLTSGCGSRQPAEPEAMPVRTLLVASGSGEQSAGYTAEIRSRYEADLSFQVGGKLVNRYVDAGSIVHKGMALAQLDQTDQRLVVASTVAALNAATAELDRARTDEARYRDLLERGLTTRAAYVNQQTASKTAQSRVEQATSDLHLNEQRLSYTTLRADADGVVTRVMTEVGSVLSPGQRVLSVARPAELEAVFDVPDGEIGGIHQATDAQLYLLTDATTAYPVRIREISPTADSVTRTYQVKASIPRPPASLLLGMSAVVKLPQVGSAAGVMLPATALFQKDGGTAVWIVKSDQRLELRPVTVGRFDTDRFLVTAGVRNGERVVTAGVHRLAAGDHVRLLEGALQ